MAPSSRPSPTAPPAFAAFVLAAGLGTRLRPLTDACPKALVPVGDRTMLGHAVAGVLRAGARAVVANAHHHAGAVERACVELGVACSPERELLGTAGGLARARPTLGDGPVLVWNADILADVDGAALVVRASAGEAHAALAVRPLPRGEGNVGVDAQGFVVRLRDERAVGSGPSDEVEGGAFLGVHALGPRLLDGLPQVGCLVGDVYLPALRAGARLATVASHGAFFDVGTPAAYLEANLAWLAARGERAWVASGAEVTAPLSRVLVGAGARVAAPLEDAVVWPGARVVAGASRVIVTPTRAVAVPRTAG